MANSHLLENSKEYFKHIGPPCTLSVSLKQCTFLSHFIFSKMKLFLPSHSSEVRMPFAIHTALSSLPAEPGLRCTQVLTAWAWRNIKWVSIETTERVSAVEKKILKATEKHSFSHKEQMVCRGSGGQRWISCFQIFLKQTLQVGFASSQSHRQSPAFHSCSVFLNASSQLLSMAERVILCGKDLVQLKSSPADRDYRAALMIKWKVSHKSFILSGKL